MRDGISNGISFSIQMANSAEDEYVGSNGSFIRSNDARSGRCGNMIYRRCWNCLERCIWHGYYWSGVCWLLLLVALGCGGIALIVFSPREPVSTVCYQQMDWAGIMKNMAFERNYFADYELLLSLYNPNRVDLNISSTRGQVHFPARGPGQREVGTITLNDFVAAAGSVTDTIGMLSFSMDRWHALDLGSAYAKGQLELAFDISLGVEVMTTRMPLLWRSRMDMDRMIVNVTEPFDDKYCRCKGSNSTPGHYRFHHR